MKSIRYNRTIIAISIIGVFPTSHAASIPHELTSDLPTPEITDIINNSAYRSVHDEIQAKWQNNNNAGTFSNQTYIHGTVIDKLPKWQSNKIQEVTLRQDSHLLNSEINGVQINLSNGFDSNDTSTAINTTIKGQSSDNKGILTLSANTNAFDTKVEENGVLNLRRGQAYGTTILSGGRQSVGSNSLAQNTIIDGGEQEISMGGQGGHAKDTIVINGGIQLVYNGTAENTHIGQGGYQLASGLVTNTHVYAGGYQRVFATDKIGAIDTIVDVDATQRIQSGTAQGNIISGTQIISNIAGEWENNQWVEDDPKHNWGSNPQALDTTVTKTGQQIIDNNGLATNSDIAGLQIVNDGGIAKSTNVLGGKQIVNTYGGIEDTTIDQQGQSIIDSGAYSVGDLTVKNGILTMVGGEEHFTGHVGKGAYAQNINLENDNASLVIQHNANTQSSHVTVDTLINNGHVIFQQQATVASPYSQLDIKKLNGHGMFHMNTNVSANKGDFLNVTEGVNGQFKVAVADSGQEISQDPNNKTYHLIHAQNSVNDSFTLDRDSVDIGAYKYTLNQHKDNENDWYLSRSQSHVTPGEPDTSESAKNAFMLASVTPNIWKSELSTLRTRLGELRNDTANTAIWSKAISNKNRIHNNQVSYQQKMNGIMIGADKKIPLQDSQLYLGGMLAYSQSDLDASHGDGQVDSYSAALYGTWLHQNGYYVDALIKANRFNTVQSAHFNQQKTSANSNTNGIGLALEVGKFIDLDTFYIEPYAQLSAFHAQKNDYQFTSKMAVSAQSNQSIAGEVGLTLGKKWVTSKNNEIQPYLRLAFNHEFNQKNDIVINKTERFVNDMSGTTAKYGLGVNTRFAKNWAAFGEFNYAHGSKRETPFDAHIGIRYTF